MYGTAGTNSDWDFVSVVVNGFFEKHGLSKEKDAMRDNGFVRYLQKLFPFRCYLVLRLLNWTTGK